VIDFLYKGKKLTWLSQVSVALNAFEEDEYFIMFEDNTFCYKSKALGGHCEPPTQRGSKRMKRTFTIQNPQDAAQTDQQKIEIIQAQKFDNLMNSWKIEPPALTANDPNRGCDIHNFGHTANVSDPYRWLPVSACIDSTSHERSLTTVLRLQSSIPQLQVRNSSPQHPRIGPKYMVNAQ